MTQHSFLVILQKEIILNEISRNYTEVRAEYILTSTIIFHSSSFFIEDRATHNKVDGMQSMEVRKYGLEQNKELQTNTPNRNIKVKIRVNENYNCSFVQARRALLFVLPH